MKKCFAILMLVLFLLVLRGVMPAAAAEDAKEGNTYHVLVINFDPTIRKAGGEKQHELNPNWNDPQWLAGEYASDMAEISHGFVNYSVVEWIDLDEMPMNTDGLSYDPDEYYDTLIAASEATDGAYWQDSSWYDWGFSFDYDYYMNRFNVYERVNSGELDEVWIFAGPMVGVTLYETQMIGKDAYWCNSPGIEKDCRQFVVYGFNYERGVGEMLEDAGHRAESIMSEKFGWPDYSKAYEDYTDWEKFSAYDLVSPGNAGVGNVHFAPNSIEDYDWGNMTYVYTDCEDWEDYPVMDMDPRLLNADEWGNGDIRLHHKWWFSLIPHAEGVNEETGKYNNWWIYFTLTPEDGWNLFGDIWYYYLEGQPAKKWLYDSAWYYFSPESGAMMTGWVDDEGYYYYMNASGAMATGWIPDGGKWYYLADSGEMMTGWLKSGDTWYYLTDSGAMATGWMEDGGAWYFFTDSGEMAAGWQYVGGVWYYFRPSGEMATGWFKDQDGTWYWFNENGHMATGWEEINGQWEMFADSGAWLYTWDGN